MPDHVPFHQPHLLEVHDVAYQLKCSPETVRRLVRRGQLLAVSLGARSWRIHPRDLQAFIDARRHGHTSLGNGHGTGDGAGG